MGTLLADFAAHSLALSGNIIALLVPLALLELALEVFALVDVIRRKPELVRGHKALWIVIIVLINPLGPIAYLIAGRKEA